MRLLRSGYPSGRLGGWLAPVRKSPAVLRRRRRRLLDRKRNPEFRGEKYRLLESPSKNVELWERRRELREAELINDGDGSEATEFYRLHREEMDEGAVVSWPARFNDDEISAIQFAMNLKFRDETAFLSEYQNEPVAKIDESGEGMVDAITIINKSSGYKRGVAPLESQLLTGFIDVHKDLLYWASVAWERNFTGVVVDWGTYPEQKKLNFQLSEARPTLGDVAKKKAFDARQKIPGLEGALTGALETLVETLFERGVQREDGALMRYDRILIDANWGEMTDVVYQFCRRSRFGANLLPSHGMGVGASSRAFGDYKAQRGDVVGLHWRVPNAIGKRSTRHAVIDANFWKSFIHGRLATAPGDPGCLSLNGDPGERGLIASHLTAEYCVPTVNERTGRRVNEWKLRMKRPDNHWFDCLVGACVGASICGAKLPTTTGETAPTRKVRRVSFSELQQRRRRR
ncbi:MAG: phage terminase large subunit family protein [Thermoguttaceae bacterium]|nr:phage terminase large subunit family protein [Thermoguttaceae bacterium]